MLMRKTDASLLLMVLGLYLKQYVNTTIILETCI